MITFDDTVLMEENKFRKLSSAIRPVIEVDGQNYLYFGGTAYLGIPQDKEFLASYIQGLEIYGINNGTSRNNNVQLGIYDDAERHAAQAYGSENALITSSGYMAAQLAVKHFGGLGKLIYAPDTHPALWITKEKVRSSFKEWTELVVHQINKSKQTDWILVSNSLNNLFPEIYDFSFLTQIDASKKIVLIADDSHGIGILNNGKGVYCAIPKRQNVEIVVVASMAKALGVDAGVILASNEVISNLKSTNEFLGASPPAAAGLYAYIHAEHIYRKAFEKQEENNLFLRKGLENNDHFRFVNGFPVYLSDDPALSDQLMAKKILISSFPYPDKNGKPVNRVVLSSWHSEENLGHLLRSI